jgi:centrosomal CEP192-like protein/fibronectin type III domain protein/List-Bact-rpt repeat protein
MVGDLGLSSDVRSAARAPWRLLVAGLVLAGVMASTRVEAASVSLSWTAPTTNADGSPLTDLAGYRVYLATSTPTCPGSAFLSVPSSTSTPGTGQSVASQVTSLAAGTTYFVRVSAVDTSGNESSCSPAASGVAQMDVAVDPTTATSFGTVTTGTTVDRAFTVQNTSTASISGTASAGAPFSVVSGGTLSLAPGASQVVTVRFAPTATGTFAGNVNVTVSGDTLSRGLSGAATAGTPATISVTKSGTGAGTVTSAPAGISCGTTCTAAWSVGTQTTLTATAAAGSTFTGWSGACTGTGTCTVTLNGNMAVTAIFDLVPAPVPVTSSLSPTTAVAGSAGLTLTVNGSGFVPSSVVRWNGVARTTTFVSGSQLRAAITSSDLASQGSIAVSVFTPAPGGGTSGAQSFVISAPAISLTSSSIAPAMLSGLNVTQGLADADGVTFAITWNAASGASSYRYAAAFNDGTAAQQGTVTGLLSLQLRMPYHVSGAAFGAFVCLRSISSTGVQSADQACSALWVPAPPVSAPVPVLSSLTPATAIAGGPAFTLTVSGSGFVASSGVRWNGTGRVTTYISSTELRASISATDIAAVSVAQVSVLTPAPGGGTSAAKSFTVTAPPDLSAPPSAPGTPRVTLIASDSGGVTFRIAWKPGHGATSYRYVAAFTDGTGVQRGTVSTSWVQLRIPYHVSGTAVSAFFCVVSVDANGQRSTSQSCAALPVPANPAATPAPLEPTVGTVG